MSLVDQAQPVRLVNGQETPRSSFTPLLQLSWLTPRDSGSPVDVAA